MALTREQILAGGSKLRSKPVPVAAFDEPLLVWEMNGLEHDRFDADTYKVGSDGKAAFQHEHYRARLFIATVKDEAGNPLFALADLAEVSKFGTLTLDPVVDAARELNAMNAAGKSDSDDALKN